MLRNIIKTEEISKNVERVKYAPESNETNIDDKTGWSGWLADKKKNKMANMNVDKDIESLMMGKLNNFHKSLKKNNTESTRNKMTL